MKKTIKLVVHEHWFIESVTPKHQNRWETLYKAIHNELMT